MEAGQRGPERHDYNRRPMRVRFEQVTKRFGAHLAVHQIDLEVQPGEFLVLLGPSGCGKTTLLRLVAGLEQADAGRIWIGDRLVNEVPPSARDVAMVFQNYALYPHFTVFDNIAFPLRVRGLTAGEIRRRVESAAARLELETLLDRKPAQLSGGQQQRVALARAIVRSPQVYLMDEPLSNLDAQLRVQTRAELKRLQQELGTTTIYVTHDQSEAMTLGGRVALLRSGRIEQLGSPMDLYRNPANRFVATFLGSPAINLLPGVWLDGAKRLGAAGVVVPITEARYEVLCRAALFGGVQGAPRRVEVGIRPEDVAVCDEAGEGRHEARVLVVEPMGNETLVTIERGDARLVARTAADVRLTAGAPVWFAFAPDRALFFDAETGARLP